MTGAEILWILFIVLSAFVSGYLFGIDEGRFKAQTEYWRRRDAEWDAEHMKGAK